LEDPRWGGGTGKALIFSQQIRAHRGKAISITGAALGDETIRGARIEKDGNRLGWTRKKLSNLENEEFQGAGEGGTCTTVVGKRRTKAMQTYRRRGAEGAIKSDRRKGGVFGPRG